MPFLTIALYLNCFVMDCALSESFQILYQIGKDSAVLVQSVIATMRVGVRQRTHHTRYGAYVGLEVQLHRALDAWRHAIDGRHK
jgi:hypothetical protein